MLPGNRAAEASGPQRIFLLETGSGAFFWTAIKRLRNNAGTHILAANFYRKFRIYSAVRGWNISERDVLFQKWSGRAAGDRANLFASQGADGIAVAADTTLDHFHADQLALRSAFVLQLF